MTTTLDQISQYASLGAELSAMFASVGIESQHTQATVNHVASVVSGATSVGTALSQAHATGGIGLLGAVLLGLQMFAPHLMPSGIQIVAVPAAPAAQPSVLEVPQ